MVDVVEVYVRDLYKEHNGKELYKGFYSIGKKIYQDNGQIVNEGFGLDREALEVLRAKIRAILIEDLKRKPASKSEDNKSKQTKLFQY
ncbi:MAG TPA: hypothetical protein VFT71_02885 [Candidatus Nitrosocosmicus sp.]|nr:hypothetical protein [Candidatus Nitrosocosmicus sp.]